MTTTQPMKLILLHIIQLAKNSDETKKFVKFMKDFQLVPYLIIHTYFMHLCIIQSNNLILVKSKHCLADYQSRILSLESKRNK